MNIGDLVKWTKAEHAYHLACGTVSLHSHRRCGIVLDRNPYRVFVLWANGDFLAQAPGTIVAINEDW